MASNIANKPLNKDDGSSKIDDKIQGVQNEGTTSTIVENDHVQTTTTKESRSTRTMTSEIDSTTGDSGKKASDETKPKLGMGENDSKIAPRSKKRKAAEGTTVGDATKKNQSYQVFNGMIEFPLEPLKHHLTCYCCKGYFREPYTVAECLHTFCKSCIFLKFHSGLRKCPKCEISLDPDPYKAVLSDRTLQELLDKIFPELKELDEKRELEFYKKRGIELKDDLVVGESKESQETQSSISKRSDNVESPSRSQQSKESDKEVCIPTDTINFKLIPDQKVKIAMNPLERPLIRTSGQLKVGQIKKYLMNKLKLLGPNVDVLCNGDPLGDELSLIFIQRTRWLHPNEDLCLHYRFGEDGVY